MKAYIGDKVRCSGITATIAKIYYQGCFDNEWDIEFVDDKGNYRHWKQYFDGGEFIPAIDSHLAAELEQNNVLRSVVVDCNGTEYTLHRLNNGNGRAFKWLVTCREPYISRLFRYEDHARRYAKFTIDSGKPSLESTYKRTFEERYVYNTEV